MKVTKKEGPGGQVQEAVETVTESSETKTKKTSIKIEDESMLGVCQIVYHRRFSVTFWLLSR